MSSAIADVFYTQRAIIFPLAVALPIAIEAGICLHQIIKNPEEIKGKILKAKFFLIDSFSRREGAGESVNDFYKRAVKNGVLALGCLALVGSAAALPFIFLPLSFAPSVAMLAAYGMGKLLLICYQGKPLEWKESLVDSFTRRTDESESAARSRILKNTAKAFVSGVCIVATIVLSFYAFGLIEKIVSLAAISPWKIPEILPSQTTFVVFLEYALVGVLHACLAVKAALKREKGLACYHLINTFLSFLFPLHYFYQAEPFRLHHSFTGLLLQLMPFRGVKALGALITLDSGWYYLFPERNSVDFMNIFIEHYSAFITILTATSIFQTFTHNNDSRARKAAPEQIV